MITRVVKLEVHADAASQFRGLFEKVCHDIHAFQGCKGLELLCEVSNPGVFFTISKWENEDALNAYRESSLFKTTWASVKPLFISKPLAWSLVVKKDLGELQDNSLSVS
jgi:quinol monooxygenase YgiN